MAKLQNRGWVLGCLGVLATLASPGAIAGNTSATIDFVADMPVPLGHWTTVVAFGMIAVAAYFLLRRHGRVGRLSLWAIVAIAAGAGTLGLQRYDLISSTYAIMSGLNFPSPNTFYPSSGVQYPVTNHAGQIRILHVTWGSLGTCYEDTPTSTPQCAQGLSLAPGAVCYLLYTCPTSPPAL